MHITGHGHKFKQFIRQFKYEYDVKTQILLLK